MNQLMAWVYDYVAEEFRFEEAVAPTGLDMTLILLSGGIVMFLLTGFIILFGKIMEQLEEGMIANTLFTDDAFIKDSKILGDLSKSTFSDLFPAQQKGIWRTRSWKLPCGNPTNPACWRRANSNRKNVLVEVCCRKRKMKMTKQKYCWNPLKTINMDI